MAGLRPARSVHLLLLFCIGSGAGALRSGGGRPQPHDCSRLAITNQSVTFPLDVDGLLHAFGGNKSSFFKHLGEIGVDSMGLTMRVPNKVGTGCLDPAHLHLVVVGDSMARQTFEAFLRSGGKNVPVEQLAELDALDEAAVFCSPQQGGAVELKTVRDDAGVATYVFWGGYTHRQGLL